MHEYLAVILAGIKILTSGTLLMTVGLIFYMTPLPEIVTWVVLMVSMILVSLGRGIFKSHTLSSLKCLDD